MPVTSTLAQDPAVRWLIKSRDPSIRYHTLRDLLDSPDDSAEVKMAKKLIPSGPRTRLLLERQRPDGGFGVHPYQKWTGAHWRLVSLVDLGIPSGHKASIRATRLVLDWVLGKSHLGAVQKINGLTRRCASQEGNALGVCSRLGLADDERVSVLAESLVEWQWPDGGWNCDRREEAHHSSFNESLSTLWGLTEYYHETDDKDVRKTIDAASEFFLRHHLFRSEKTGKVIHENLVKLHYPLYWHYDILQALRILSLAGKLSDPRTREALDLVEGKRRPDGKWHADAYYWSLQKTGPKSRTVIPSNLEIVDWGRNGPNEFITLNALRVLKTAGRVVN